MSAMSEIDLGIHADLSGKTDYGIGAIGAGFIRRATMRLRGCIQE